MDAAVITNGELTVERRQDPTPKSTEVVVSVAAAGINGADLLQRRGFYPAPPGAPADIPGLEFAGTIVALGDDVTSATIGERVMGISAGGAQATLLCCDEAHLLRVPDSVDLTSAGGFAEAYCTAHDALVSQGNLRSGDRILISGAAGGVGTAAVQLAAALGATVVASVRHEHLHDAVRALGAHEVIDPEATASAGPYDVVLELVGAANLELVWGSLALGARIVVIGVGGGAKVEVNLLALMGARATLSGSTLRARSRTDKAVVTARVAHEVVPLFGSGVLSVPVAATYPLSEIKQAYERFAAGSKLGKIIVTFDD